MTWEYKARFYELMEQRFLVTEEFVKDIRSKRLRSYFNRDPVVISKGIKGLEKKIREDETIITAITMLQKSLTKTGRNIHLVKPDPIYIYLTEL